MIIASHTTMAPSPPRPSQYQLGVGRYGPDEGSKQVTNFRNGKRSQTETRRREEYRGGWDLLSCRSRRCESLRWSWKCQRSRDSGRERSNGKRGRGIYNLNRGWYIGRRGVNGSDILTLRTDDNQESMSHHDKSYMAVPGSPATHFVLTQAQIFACFKIIFDAPPIANRRDHHLECCARLCEDEVIVLLFWMVNAPTNK
jgi:hypothetical protein